MAMGFSFLKVSVKMEKVVIVIYSVCVAESSKMIFTMERWEKVCSPVWLVTCQGRFTFLRNWLWLHS